MEPRDKTVAESMAETCHIVMAGDLNDSGRLFGGVLLRWIDETAGIVGRRHAQMNVTTGTIENLRFLKGAYIKDTVIVSGKVTYVGNASMEVKVESYVEHIDGGRELINIAYLTMVGMGDDDRPHRLPRLILTSDEERQEWRMAEERRAQRLRQAEQDASGKSS